MISKPKSWTSARNSRRQYDGRMIGPLPDADPRAISTFAVLEMMDRLTCPDPEAGIRAVKARRPPGWADRQAPLMVIARGGGGDRRRLAG
ncbi:MAG: hypothetical protein ABSG68_06110 [Thermoguttaceae bacterium]|jgi:hypothetical protein